MIVQMVSPQKTLKLFWQLSGGRERDVIIKYLNRNGSIDENIDYKINIDL